MPLLKRSTRAMLFTLLVVACSDDQALDTPDHGVAIDVVTVVPDLHLDSDEGTRLDGVTDSMSDGGAEPAPDSVGDAATGSDSASRSDTGADTSTDVGTPPLFDSSVSSSDAATPTSDNGTDVAIDSGPDNGSDLPPMLGDCTTYCADMAEVCMMEGFHKPEHCLEWCASDKVGIALGTLEDTDTHTVGCRQHWLEKARDAAGPERAVYCSYAAASGGDQCGTWCENWCAIGTRTCTAANADYPNNKPKYFDAVPTLDADEECQAACNFATETTLPLLPMVMQHFGYGNTIQCRLHHYQAAVLQGAEQSSAYGLHCGHGAPQPSGLCRDDAEPNHINYCEYAVVYCPSLFAPGVDITACRGMLLDLVNEGVYAQEGFESFSYITGANLGCLNHHIMQAVHDPAACGRGDWNPARWGPVGEGVCFD